MRATVDSDLRERRRARLRRGAYLLPSLFTIGNILLGFYAVIRAFRGDFASAPVFIFLAAVLDAMDGRIARMTGTESEFGKEFDSLADVLTFGLAPALLTFLWGLYSWGRIGWLIPLYFLCCTAIRLARFNVQTDVVDKRWFVGLPSPAAAGAIVSIIFLMPGSETQTWLRPFMGVALIGVGSLMISTFRYPSFKKVDLRSRWSYRGVLIVAAVVLVLAYRPTAFFFTAAALYTLAGPVGWLVGRFRRTPTDDEQRGTPDETTVPPAGTPSP